MKSKLILFVSIVVVLVVSISLNLVFDSLGISIRFYDWSTEEEKMTFAGLYSLIIGVLLGTKAYWSLTGKVPGYRDIDKIEQKIGWWYWLVGSTIWAVTIYLIGLINIKPTYIEDIIDAALTVSIVYFLWKHFLEKINNISADLYRNKAIKDAQEAEVKQIKEAIALQVNASQSKKIKDVVEKALHKVLELLNEIQDNIHYINKELPNTGLSEDNESEVELEIEISNILNSFNTSMSWDIKKEIQEAIYTLQKSNNEQLVSEQWMDREIFASIDLAISYMQNDFMNLDKVVKELNNKKPIEKYGLLNILITESVTNMLLANNKIHDIRKSLFDEVNSLN